MDPKQQNQLRELAYHLGLLTIQDYALTVEPNLEVVQYVSDQVLQSSRTPGHIALYLDKDRVDLDEHQYEARILRNLEDLLMLGQLPDATLAAGELGQQARELGAIFEELAQVSAGTPTSDHVNKLLELVSKHQGHLESAESCKLFMYRLTLLLIKLGVADQELFELLERLPDGYTHQYKSWQPDYAAGQDSGNRATPAPAGAGLDKVVDQWLALLLQSNRTFEVLLTLELPAQYSTDGVSIEVPGAGTGPLLFNQVDVEHHVLGLMLMAGR